MKEESLQCFELCDSHSSSAEGFCTRSTSDSWIYLVMFGWCSGLIWVGVGGLFYTCMQTHKDWQRGAVLIRHDQNPCSPFPAAVCVSCQKGNCEPESLSLSSLKRITKLNMANCEKSSLKAERTAADPRCSAAIGRADCKHRWGSDSGSRPGVILRTCACEAAGNTNPRPSNSRHFLNCLISSGQILLTKTLRGSLTWSLQINNWSPDTDSPDWGFT